MVRVGQAANVREELRGFCLAALVAETPEAAEVCRLHPVMQTDEHQTHSLPCPGAQVAQWRFHPGSAGCKCDQI